MISPLDDRYSKELEKLNTYFSEESFTRERVFFEWAWLRDILNFLQASEFHFNQEDLEIVENLLYHYKFEEIKELESETRHDVKAIQLYLARQFPEKISYLVHLGLTSEDVNNIARTSLLSHFKNQLQVSLLKDLIELLIDYCSKWKYLPFPAHTHGQIASPTTLGKEFGVFAHRLIKQYQKLRDFKFSAKLNGATGNYSALSIINNNSESLMDLSREFIEGFGLIWNPITTQIEDNDILAEYLGLIARINNIILDLDRDCWEYFSREYFVFPPKPGEVGSSTMPYKINPTKFENSEGNLQFSNTLLHTLSDNLCISRMQRDLSGSTLARNIGVALGHSYLAWVNTKQGLAGLVPNNVAISNDLQKHPEVLTEAYQIMLRVCGIDGYQIMFELTRSGAGLNHIKAEILDYNLYSRFTSLITRLTPETYIGIAPELCDSVIKEWEKIKA